MHDKDKIIIMSKMAVYDKRDFRRDSQANHYFRHDYIYKRNMQMRFFVGIGCLILLLLYVLYLFAVENTDIFTVNYQNEAFRMLSFVLVVMFGYSFIGTIVYTREFLVAQKRVSKYFALMEQLDDRNEARDKQTTAKRANEANYKYGSNDDESFEKFEPYRPGGSVGPEYRYRSSDDPEFWAEDDFKPPYTR